MRQVSNQTSGMEPDRIKRVLVDMDGVLADVYSKFFDLYGLNLSPRYYLPINNYVLYLL